MREPLWRRRPASWIFLLGSVSVPELRATHISRKPARYPSLPAIGTRQALPHGLSWPRFQVNIIGWANEVDDWRIYADFAQVLITIARPMYSNESLGFDLDGTVYALDSTTIDLCLSVFPWAHFQSSKGAVKMHTLLDLRGSIPTFIEVSDGKCADVRILDEIVPEAGSFYVMDRGYLDFERLHVFQRSGAFFVTRTKSNVLMRRHYSRDVDFWTGFISDHTVVLKTADSFKHYPDPLRRVRYRDGGVEQNRTLVFLTNNFGLP